MNGIERMKKGEREEEKEVKKLYWWFNVKRL